MSEKDYDTSPQPGAGRDQQTALEEGLDRLVAAGFSRSDAQQMIDQYQREYRAIWGEPQDWVIDRHDVAGMIDRRAEEQLRLQQRRGQQTIGITDGITGGDRLTDFASDATDATDATDSDVPRREASVVGLECPECGEDAVEQSPGTLVPYEAQGMAVPRYAHTDGEPLCPVVGPSGYQPAQPREVLADPLEDETARRAQLAQWHTDDRAVEQAVDDGIER